MPLQKNSAGVGAGVLHDPFILEDGNINPGALDGTGKVRVATANPDSIGFNNLTPDKNNVVALLEARHFSDVNNLITTDSDNPRLHHYSNYFKQVTDASAFWGATLPEDYVEILDTFTDYDDGLGKYPRNFKYAAYQPTIVDYVEQGEWVTSDNDFTHWADRYMGGSGDGEDWYQYMSTSGLNSLGNAYDHVLSHGATSTYRQTGVSDAGYNETMSLSYNVNERFGLTRTDTGLGLGADITLFGREAGGGQRFGRMRLDLGGGESNSFNVNEGDINLRYKNGSATNASLIQLTDSIAQMRYKTGTTNSSYMTIQDSFMEFRYKEANAALRSFYNITDTQMIFDFHNGVAANRKYLDFNSTEARLYSAESLRIEGGAGDHLLDFRQTGGNGEPHIYVGTPAVNSSTGREIQVIPVDGTGGGAGLTGKTNPVIIGADGGFSASSSAIKNVVSLGEDFNYAGIGTEADLDRNYTAYFNELRGNSASKTVFLSDRNSNAELRVNPTNSVWEVANAVGGGLMKYLVDPTTSAGWDARSIPDKAYVDSVAGGGGDYETGETYTVSNVTPDRTFDPTATNPNEVAMVLATLIQDLKNSTDILL